METNHTDRALLSSGLKKMVVALLCMFIGPTLTYISVGIQDTTKKYAALILGILICLLALYFSFKGIMTIINSMFKKG